MRAVTYSSFGSADAVLSVSDTPDQDPGPGEVTVELAFSGVNPSDVKARSGSRPGVTKPAYPIICPHSDGSGTVIKTGEGVAPERLGESVWIWNGQWQRPFGTAAETITLPQAQAVPLPKGVSLETGASLGIPGLTAAHTVFGGGDIAGSTVLIHGGNGSVGHLAVQLAKWGGATVIATASPSGFQRCLAAGADTVLDYRSENLSQEVADAAKGDAIGRIIDVEFGANIAQNAEIIAPNGTLAVYGSAVNMTPTIPFGALLFKAVTIDICLIYILAQGPRRKAIETLHSALSDKALCCPVAEIFPLSKTANAHAAVEAGNRHGAVLIDTAKT